MNNLAIAFFGTCSGTNGHIIPSGFDLPDSLHRIIDTPLPFLWGKEVFRFYKVSVNNEENLILLAAYTKIDDFGGPRNGAFAGAGVFIRQGIVDSKILVKVLRDMLSNLIASTSNGKQFIIKIQDAVSTGKINQPKSISQLIDSYSSSIKGVDISYGLSNRVLVSLDDPLINSPENFFEICMYSANSIGRDTYFSNDLEFHNAASNDYDLTFFPLSKRLLNSEQHFQKQLETIDVTYKKRIEVEKQAKEQIQQSLLMVQSTLNTEINKATAPLKLELNQVTLQVTNAKDLSQKLRQSNSVLESQIQQVKDRSNFLEQELKRKTEQSSPNHTQEIAKLNTKILVLEGEVDRLEESEKILENQVKNLRKELKVASGDDETPNTAISTRGTIVGKAGFLGTGIKLSGKSLFKIGSVVITLILVSICIYFLSKLDWTKKTNDYAVANNLTVTAVTTVPAGGSTTVPAGGSTTVPAGGSATVPAGGSTTVPAGGSTTVPAGGSTTVPAGGSATVPAGGNVQTSQSDASKYSFLYLIEARKQILFEDILNLAVNKCNNTGVLKDDLKKNLIAANNIDIGSNPNPDKLIGKDDKKINIRVNLPKNCKPI